MNLKDTKIHFVGIGGIGMSGIAELLVNRGCAVTGSDLSENVQVERLKAMGVNIFKGHSRSHLPQACDVVVFSSAVKSNNPEVLEAKKRKIPIIPRAEMLAELMRFKRGVAVGGSHGKTTTTSMAASVLLEGQLDPTIVIGGRFDLIKSNASLGKGEWLLAEADESDGSFLSLTPEVVVVTNIDNDHLDHFKTFDNLVTAFKKFINRIPFYGCAIICSDDKWALKLCQRFEKRLMTYGLKAPARLQAKNIKAVNSNQTFDVFLDGNFLATAELHVPGRHNVLNALAAVAMGLELKLSIETICNGLKQYKGVDRRLQKKGEFNGALLIDDYGHHPTEVEATLSAVKEAFPNRRLIVGFQPHRYSRTKSCWAQFLKCFKKADILGLLDIYPAGEKPIKNISSKRLAHVLNKKSVQYWGDIEQAKEKLRENLRPQDVFLSLGAGDVWKLTNLSNK